MIFNLEKYLNIFLHLDKTETASETGETQQQEKTDPCKPHTDTATTSKQDDPDDEQNLAKEGTKEAYKADTESLSSDDPPAKDNTDDGNFQPGTTSSSYNDDDDDMESDENIPRHHKRKNQG